MRLLWQIVKPKGHTGFRGRFIHSSDQGQGISTYINVSQEVSRRVVFMVLLCGSTELEHVAVCDWFLQHVSQWPGMHSSHLPLPRNRSNRSYSRIGARNRNSSTLACLGGGVSAPLRCALASAHLFAISQSTEAVKSRMPRLCCYFLRIWCARSHHSCTNINEVI